ncbi:MAG: FKBP-type peptidyl-prolyl cis-trans isomerase [Ilumatobacteraceae bacterium]|jgi:FKBP-type peptidyl-prolyl cis-trans isomerase|nr:FKBP-type peptidyl-prolyl cis-trans isomerase [Ilumatobacteraceae bacterium]
MSQRSVRHFLASLAVAGLTLTACGEDDSSSDVSVTESEISLVPSDPADESKEPDVVLPAETPTELVITDITDGEGDAAAEGDTVFVFYVGVLSADGSRFDGNFDGEPFAVTLGQGAVIEGWDQGLLGMKAGGRRQLDIPAELAYGEAGSGDAIPPNSAISFVVDMLAIVPAIDPADEPELNSLQTPSLTKLEIEDLVIGDGAEAEAGSTVVVQIIAFRGDTGEKLVSTWGDPSPVTFTLVTDGSLPGIVDGLPGMKVGGRRILNIPYEDAFGDQGNTELGLPEKTDLILVVDLFAAF